MAPSKVFSLSSLRGGSSSNRKTASSSPSTPSPVAPVPAKGLHQSSWSRPPSRAISSAQPTLGESSNNETPPELLPIFSYLSSQSKKLYTEGYFLKLTDLNPDGKPHADRQWLECFAQLVGTVLSLWDAAALDAAGEDGEVVPTFLNLTDASIKMIENLPTKASDSPALRNVLSVSTAGKNRYLFHFNSHHSLIQWTAGIRLALFELATLQEAYTGALIGSKAKAINGITNLMERTRFKYEDWARVRFAAGEPWKKYWTVISPPEEKAYQKWKKEMKKGKHPKQPLELGNIKFYLTKKTKKVEPLATITKAYCCYAVYPQSEALIEHSTLVKVEGMITHHNTTEPREGFVFIMPDTHPSVSGFEMMVRWLIPAFDAFHLYGRPERLAADVMDMRSLMFAMPREAKYGYLEVADVAHLISAESSKIVSEAEWRKKLKELTLTKMQTVGKGTRNSFPIQPRAAAPPFDDNRSANSSPAVPYPPANAPMNSPGLPGGHQRSLSEAQGYMNQHHNRASNGYPPYGRPSTGSPPQLHGSAFASPQIVASENPSDSDDTDMLSSTKTRALRPAQLELPEDIPVTPNMAHTPSSRPPHPLPPTPGYTSRMSISTMNALVHGSAAGMESREGRDRNSGSDIAEEYEPPSRESHESNMFESLPSYRNQGVAQYSAVDRQGEYGQNSPRIASRDGNRSYTPSPHHPLPRPPSQSAVNSHVTVYDSSDSYGVRSNHRSFSPQPRVTEGRVFNSIGAKSSPTTLKLPQSDEQKRFSWELERSGELEKSRSPPPLVLNEASSSMTPLPSPPIPAKIPLKVHNAPQPPSLKTDIFNKSTASYRPSATDTPQSTDSVGSLANHIINPEALNRVSQRFSQPGKATPDGTSPVRRGSSHSGSEYEDDSVDDYASSTDVESEMAKIPPRKEGARTGVMKTVGQKMVEDVVVGDSHYKPVASTHQQPDVTSDIPKIDFGRTYSHGRSLSTELISTADHHRRSSQHNVESQVTVASQSRNSSGGIPNAIDEGKRISNLRQHSSPEPSVTGDFKTLQGPDNSRQVSGGRHIPWQPGLVQQNSGNRASVRAETPERFVAEQAAAAKQQTQIRNRYLHSRRPSRNASAEQMPRPASRVGNTAFSTHGLISAADVSSHLSAREQEYIARKTGTTLLQMDTADLRKQPSHQAGLLGALEAREREKQDMKSATVQQALAQRQLHVRTLSSSSRAPSDSFGRAMGQQAQQVQHVPQLQQNAFLQNQWQQEHNFQPPTNYNYGNSTPGGFGQYNGR
ncbi:hypothetical protein BDZ91DRAFT_39445 [Kalaharituber pfeilii]|nr:hypothetical protein BDZ91DRAFT_39445 [Kalaharituber pfeilii]